MGDRGPARRQTMPRIHRNDTQTAFPPAWGRARPSGHTVSCGAVVMAGGHVLLIDAEREARAQVADRLRVHGGNAVDAAMSQPGAILDPPPRLRTRDRRRAVLRRTGQSPMSQVRATARLFGFLLVCAG